MKRLALFLLLLTLFAAGVPSAFGQSCAAPPPTYTPTPGYRATVQAVAPSNLLVYYPLNETSGTVAEDDSGNNADGSYSGVTLNSTTFLTGEAAGSWDGINDFVSLYTTYLASNFNSNEGTILVWFRVSGASLWTDGVQRYLVILSNNASNRILITKATASNNVQGFSSFGGTNKNSTSAIFGGSTDWIALMYTWSKSADQVKFWGGGVQLGSTLTSLGTWSGALSSSAVTVGASSTAGGAAFHGNIAQVAIWNTALDPTQVAVLATVDPVLTIPPTATLCPSWTPTFTPSHTPTYTPTPSNTPNPHIYWQIDPSGPTGTALPDATGTPTPIPAQWVRFDYTASAGQVGIIFFEAIILFAVVCMWLILISRRNRRAKAQPQTTLTDNRSN